MPTPEKRLRLMQLASSNLPVGGYSWSQGLEWAVEAGWVPDAAAFERWQLQQMEQSFFTVDLPLFARLYRACENDDLPSAQRWTAWLLACRETRELPGRDTAADIAAGATGDSNYTPADSKSMVLWGW